MALASLRREVGKPSGIFDPYAALAALEHLVDTSRDRRDPAANRYNVIFKQSRPLLHHPQFRSILLKLLGDKDEMEVSKVIEKAVKGGLAGSSPPRSPVTASGVLGNRAQPPWSTAGDFPHTRRFSPYPAGARRARQQPRCFACRQIGHFARFCPRERGRY